MIHEPECNGLCVMAYELLEGHGADVAIAHPDCDLHGEGGRLAQNYRDMMDRPMSISEELLHEMTKPLTEDEA